MKEKSTTRPDGDGGEVTLTPLKKFKGKAFHLTREPSETIDTPDKKKKIKMRKKNKTARKARRKNR